MSDKEITLDFDVLDEHLNGQNFEVSPEQFERTAQVILESGQMETVSLPEDNLQIDPATGDIPEGVEFVIVDGVAIPLSVFLGEVQELEPAAPGSVPQVLLSGGASTVPFVLGSIGPGPELTELLPPTALLFTVPEERELTPFADEDDEPDVEVIPIPPGPGPNPPPGVTPADAEVNEAALDGDAANPAGTNAGSNAETVGGEIVVNTGSDELASLVVGGVDVTTGGTVQGEYGILTVTLNPDGTYSFSYVLTGNVDHPTPGSTGTAEGITDDFEVVVTDEDGDTGTDTLVIAILDDGPIAVNDSGSQTEEDAPVTVNVMENDTEGADGVDITNASDVFVVPNSLDASGTVVYNNDGTFTYIPGPGEDGGTDGVVTFQYTITDGDGDTSTATVTIDMLEDSEPGLEIVPDNPNAGGNAFVNEAGLDDPADDLGTDPTSDSEFASGIFDIDTGNDTVGSLVINGVDVTNGGVVPGANGHGDLTVTLNPDGTYSWEYELTDNTTEHTSQGTGTDGVIDEFVVTVTDSDGDTASGTFTVDIIDDVPVAMPLVLTGDDKAVVDESLLTEDGIRSASFDISDNFETDIVYGADGPGSVEYALMLGGSNVGSGFYALGDDGAQGSEIILTQSGNTITGSADGVDYFTIEVDPDTGEVTFTQLENIWHGDMADHDDPEALVLEPGLLTITQTVTDADGDTDTAAIDLGTGGIFIIEDDGPAASAEALSETADIALVDESLASEDGIVSATVTLSDNFSNSAIDYGTDGPGSVEYALVLNGDDVPSVVFIRWTLQAGLAWVKRLS